MSIAENYRCRAHYTLGNLKNSLTDPSMFSVMLVNVSKCYITYLIAKMNLMHRNDVNLN